MRPGAGAVRLKLGKGILPIYSSEFSREAHTSAADRPDSRGNAADVLCTRTTCNNIHIIHIS